jgi:hypothetical protein
MFAADRANTRARGGGGNQFIAAVAALIPADVIAIHALILTWTTTTDDSGATSIVNRDLLRASFPILIGVAVLLFVIGRGLSPKWEWKDFVGLVIPPAAFGAWTALIGTSAITPWIPAGTPEANLWFAATVLAAILVALNLRIKPAG